MTKANEIKDLYKSLLLQDKLTQYGKRKLVQILEEKDREIIRLGRKANEYKKAINCKDCDCSVCEAHINTLELIAEIEKKDIALKECERNLIEERQNRIKKDKQIDLMAEYIDFDKMNFECSSLCVKDNCQKECIKQYFEKKAEEDK